MSYTLASEVQFELVVKKSRFIGYLIPCTDKSEAKGFIEKLKKQYPDARHVCSAFKCGAHTGLDDDGEPSGTAAKPMFQILQVQDLEQVLAVVVRYFGGIKLGAGGLIRAYGGTISECVKLAEKCPVIQYQQLCFSVPFALENKIRHYCEQSDITVDDVYYNQSNNVEFLLRVREEKIELIKDALSSLTLGQIEWSTGK